LSLTESLHGLRRCDALLRSRPGLRRLMSDPYLVLHRFVEAQRVVRVLRCWHAKQKTRGSAPHRKANRAFVPEINPAA